MIFKFRRNFLKLLKIQNERKSIYSNKFEDENFQHGAWPTAPGSTSTGSWSRSEYSKILGIFFRKLPKMQFFVFFYEKSLHGSGLCRKILDTAAISLYKDLLVVFRLKIWNFGEFSFFSQNLDFWNFFSLKTTNKPCMD